MNVEKLVEKIKSTKDEPQGFSVLQTTQREVGKTTLL